MKMDKYVLAAMWGALATLAAEAVSLMLLAAGLGNQDVYSMDSLLVTQDTPSPFIGLIVNLVVGGSSAVVLCFLLDRLGSQCVLIKGIMMSLFIWFVFNLYSGAFIEGRFVEVRADAAHYNQVLGVLADGAAVGALFRLTIFKKKA
jgi:hypothetical protein